MTTTRVFLTVVGLSALLLTAGCGQRSTNMVDRHQYWIGYSDTRCDDPRGQYYNGLTKRAMVVRADGTDRREVGRSLITREYQTVGFAGWWPDGRAIIGLSYKSPEVGAWETQNKTFAHGRTEGIELDSCLVDIDTGETVNLTAIERVSNYNAGLAPWPGDLGRATFAPIVNGLQQPYVMDADGRNKRSLASGKEGFTYGLNVSPDGRRIAYHKNYQIYVADKDGSNPRAIDPDPTHTFQFCPTWSPDGKWLLFLTPEHYKCHPHIVAADGTGLRKLADRGGYRSVMEMLDYPDFHSGSSDLPVWSPDSKWVYYTAQVGQAVELMRVSLDGRVQQLTHSPAGSFCYHPKVSPDGRLVVFGSTRDGARALYVSDADGGNVQAITVPTKGRAQLHAYWRPMPADLVSSAPTTSKEATPTATTQPGAAQIAQQPQQVTIFAEPNTYASFPNLIRTADGLIVTFQIQNLDELKSHGKHPHYGFGRADRYAVHRFGEEGWTITETFPTPSGPVLDAGRILSPLGQSGVLHLKRGWDPTATVPTPLPLKGVIHRPGQAVEEFEIRDLGPLPRRPTPFRVVRMDDGSFLAAAYGPLSEDQFKPVGSVEGQDFEHDWPQAAKRATPYFLKGSPDGRTWTYLSQIPNHHVFSLAEPDLAVMDDGRIICLIRTHWPTHLKDRWPEHVCGNGMRRDGYGWFLYQSESTDGGRTWTEPVQLPIWGHPPYMLKLASGNVLLVFGHRRPPWSIRAILSRDGGRTWDLSTLKTLREFKPGNYDLGYPVATQLPDGRIFCAYYGYSTRNVDLYVPHGIFATIFSEQWLAEPSADSTSNAPTTSKDAASIPATQPASAFQPQPGTIVFAFISYSGGAYHKGDTSTGSIYSVRSDGTGLTRVIDLGCANNPKVPPDGQWVYFQSNKTGNWHIYRCHLDGSGLEDLTADEKLGKDSFGFDLSPDGRKIVFTSAHSRVSRVATMNPDGSDQRLLASELGFCYMASFSPDGKRIVFAHTAEDYRLKLANLDGSNMIGLTPDLKECFAPQFTPDGQWIYFIRRDGDMYRVSPDATRLEQLTQGNGYVELHMNAEDEHGSTDAPRISPDGRRITFCGMDKGLSQVRVMNIDGTGLRQLTNLPDRCGRVRWSPNSRQISFVSFVRDSQPQLFVIDADGGQPRQITDLPGAVYLMEWAPR